MLYLFTSNPRVVEFFVSGLALTMIRPNIEWQSKDCKLIRFPAFCYTQTMDRIGKNQPEHDHAIGIDAAHLLHGRFAPCAIGAIYGRSQKKAYPHVCPHPRCDVGVLTERTSCDEDVPLPVFSDDYGYQFFEAATNRFEPSSVALYRYSHSLTGEGLSNALESIQSAMFDRIRKLDGFRFYFPQKLEEQLERLCEIHRFTESQKHLLRHALRYAYLTTGKIPNGCDRHTKLPYAKEERTQTFERIQQQLYGGSNRLC